MTPNLGPPRIEPLAGLDAWTAARKLADRPHLLFLDSAAGASHLSKYSYVAADPIAWTTGESGDPFAAVRSLLARGRAETHPDAPPFQGGVAGLLGYALAHRLERLPRPTFDDLPTPELAVGLYDWVLAFDHGAGRAWLVTTPLAAPGRRDAVLGWLDRPTPAFPAHARAQRPLQAPRFPTRHPGVWSNFDRAGYVRTAARAIEYVRAGDCFQVNLSQRLLTAAPESPLRLYERLRARNAAPFAGYLDAGDVAIVSASPERFLQLSAGHVVTRPIKGTRPRGVYPMEDMARSDDLLESLKDRAENVMIVDLLRNDLGRVCRYGSIAVTAVCQLETYRFVHHLVSEVHGDLRPGLDAVDLLRATFPGGSITGAPKVRAMEIIAELEGVARGPYCGSLGYLGLDGSMDTNLLIRTFAIGDGWARFSVGGGIVADSDPEREYEETWHKAAGLLRALEA